MLFFLKKKLKIFFFDSSCKCISPEKTNLHCVFFFEWKKKRNMFEQLFSLISHTLVELRMWKLYANFIINKQLINQCQKCFIECKKWINRMFPITPESSFLSTLFLLQNIGKDEYENNIKLFISSLRFVYKCTRAYYQLGNAKCFFAIQNAIRKWRKYSILLL